VPAIQEMEMTEETKDRSFVARRTKRCAPIAVISFLLLLLAAAAGSRARADEPFGRSRDYDLQNARIELRFDLDQRQVIGQVTHTLTTLKDGLRELDFDSVGLTILSARLDGTEAHFTTGDAKLRVDLSRASKAGEKHEVTIRYQGSPKKGLYFILPNKSYSGQPKEIWTQGEAEDTRYYIPIYDYPNDRTTTEMIVTVPRDWVTVSNGKLESVVDAGQGMKTWTWRQSQPISTYLISLVAGEFDESKKTWRNMPVDYRVPRGEAERIEPTFARTPLMLSFFSERLGVPYPWDKYDQTAVDQFTLGGMENVSATTLTARSLLHPALVHESLEGADGLISHEMSHQWFGDLVTTKDWANLWLNEGFATFMATLWEEHQYGAENAAYARWRAQAAWFRQRRMFGVPIVTHQFRDALEYAGNIYGKAGLVLQMLREQLGDDAFFHALQHYLEVNRLQNVATADLIKAIEESTHVDVDRFFDEWIYGAGAPRFAVSTTYDAGAKEVRMEVKQTQDVRGSVGLFEVPVEVAVTTAAGTKSFPITVAKADETFSFPADSEPLLVLFDKGDKILKAVEFHKPAAEWIYQLQHAEDVPDRVDAALGLGDLKGNDSAIAALGEAAAHDRFWGVRVQALTALGKLGGAQAEKAVLPGLADAEPWVREVAVDQLAKFSDDSALAARLTEIAGRDSAYRVRAAALTALGQRKAEGAMGTLENAAKTDSPDDVIRRAALRAMGALGNDQAAPRLIEWLEQGKPMRLRTAAIESLGKIAKKDQSVESRLIALLNDPDFDIRLAAVYALGERGDPAAIEPLENLRQSGDIPSGGGPVIEQQIARIKNPGEAQGRERQSADNGGNASPTGNGANQQPNQQIVERLDKIEQNLTEMNEKLKKIEQQQSRATP
jgi:aminopeptidase N